MQLLQHVFPGHLKMKGYPFSLLTNLMTFSYSKMAVLLNQHNSKRLLLASQIEELFINYSYDIILDISALPFKSTLFGRKSQILQFYDQNRSIF